MDPNLVYNDLGVVLSRDNPFAKVDYARIDRENREREEKCEHYQSPVYVLSPGATYSLDLEVKPTVMCRDNSDYDIFEPMSLEELDEFIIKLKRLRQTYFDHLKQCKKGPKDPNRSEKN